MPKLITICEYCGEIAVEQSHAIEGPDYVVYLRCGHTIVTPAILHQQDETITAQSGKQPYPFQLDGIKFAEKSNIRCLIADEPGLGKTIQAACLIKLHRDELGPIAILCKRKLIRQWFHEIYDWTGIVPQIITDGKSPFHFDLGFNIFIISLDTLRNVDGYADAGIKTVIIDECQLIKNPESKRSQAVRRLCSKATHIIALSGTPIKNHFGEYFTILNILRPEIFREYRATVLYYADWIWTGKGYKVGGLNRSREDIFRQQTQDFIIRRRRDDVLPDLPKINRTYQLIEIEDRFRTRWNEELKSFTQYYEDIDGKITQQNMMNILQYITRMRHLTGVAKVDDIVEYVKDYLEQREDTKITVFYHHKDIGILIENALKPYCKENGIEIAVLNPESPRSDEYVANCAKSGWVSNDPSVRVLLASTLANSEGLNLQKCDTAILAERQWNPTNEEQAESRFPRPGSEAQSILINYPTALNTIDEWFGELVEKKRAYIKSTLDGEDYVWSENGLLIELAPIIASKGRALFNPTKEIKKPIAV